MLRKGLQHVDWRVFQGHAFLEFIAHCREKRDLEKCPCFRVADGGTSCMGAAIADPIQ